MNLYEGLLDKIASLIASKASKTAIRRALEIAPSDAEMADTMRDLRDTYTKFEKALETFCKRHPQSPECKDKTPKTFKYYRK